MTRSLRVFISVAEDSADLHASSLVRAAREALPGATFLGFAGPRMVEAGVESLADLTSGAAMLTGVLRQLRTGWRALAQAQRAWRTVRPDVVVLMDSTALHLPMAARAKAEGLPVLYYIAPQTWASRSGRNRRLAQDCDRVASIFPFEAEFLARHRVPAEFVGHPLLEHLERTAPTAGHRSQTTAPEEPVCAILPGSRSGVIARVLPLQLDVIRRMRRPVRPLISCVAPRRRELIRSVLASKGVQAELVEDDNAGLLRRADIALVASGTATLETAYFGVPMIVMYEAGSWLGAMHRVAGRFMLQTPHLSLVNILADSRAVPEFMPVVRDVALVARTADRLLDDAEWRAQMRRSYDRALAPLRGGAPSRRVCALIEELARSRD